MPASVSVGKASVAVIGLMSGTSLDAVDASLVYVEQYGELLLGAGESIEVKIPSELRGKCLALSKTCAADVDFARSCAAVSVDPRKSFRNKDIAGLELEITEIHARAVAKLLNKISSPSPTGDARARPPVSLVGFHGQTIYHHPHGPPSERFTWQLGDGKLLAKLTNMKVVSQFRFQDVGRGGEGAPLAPLYHVARMRLSLAANHVPAGVVSAGGATGTSIAILNIGGVSNVTFLRVDSASNQSAPLAFDCGPGNALIDDFMHRKTGTPTDQDGVCAAAGNPREDIINEAVLNYAAYLSRKPPKSLDRNTFSEGIFSSELFFNRLSINDGAATLARFTAVCIAMSVSLVGEDHAPKVWYVCGGGRHNPTLMKHIMEEVCVPVFPVEALEWNGDSLEAECFGYLAARVVAGKHTSLPTTTGCSEPVCGGLVDMPV